MPRNTPDPEHPVTNTEKPTPEPVGPPVPVDPVAETPGGEVTEEIASGEATLEGPTNGDGNQIVAEEPAPEPIATNVEEADPAILKAIEEAGDPPAPVDPPAGAEVGSEESWMAEAFVIAETRIQSMVDTGYGQNSREWGMLDEAITLLAYHPELETTLREWTRKRESPSGSTSPVGILREFLVKMRSQ